MLKTFNFLNNLHVKVRLYKVLKIALPAALQSILDLLAMAVSFIFIGFLGGAAISALGGAVTYFMYIYAITTIFSVGTNATVSRKVGAKDLESASSILSSVLYFSLLLSVPLFVLAYLTYIPFFSLLKNISTEAREMGIDYLFVILFTLPFFVVKIIIVAAMSASGDTKTPFKIKLLATILNIFLNYALIQGHFGLPAFGLQGAAYANLLTNIFEPLILLIVLLRGKYMLHLRLVFCKEAIKEAIRIGFPSGLERFFTLTSMAILTIIVTSYGEQAFAGYMIGGRVEAFVFMPNFGFMIAAMSLMGQNLGAKREFEAKRCVLMTLNLGMLFMGTLGLALIFTPILISRPFSDDMRILEYSALYLFYIGFSQIPLAINFILDGALRGAGITKVTLLVNGVCIWCIRIIPASCIGYFGFDLSLIYLIMCLETFLRSGIFLWLFQKGIWKDSYRKTHNLKILH